MFRADQFLFLRMTGSFSALPSPESRLSPLQCWLQLRYVRWRVYPCGWTEFLSCCFFCVWSCHSSVQFLSHVWLLVTPWTAACQASLFITNCQSLLKLMSIESVKPSNHLTLCHPFPASGSFPMSQLFTSGGQSIGVSASASVLPMNTQDWSSLGWTGWIFL